MIEFLTLGGVAAIHPVIAGAAVVALALLVGLEIAAKLAGTKTSFLVHCVTLLSGIALVGAVLATGPQQTVVGKLMGVLSVGLAGMGFVAGLMILRRPPEAAAAEQASSEETL
jgi:H+-translocating NAD(P) transhydrogenase subunit alpha